MRRAQSLARWFRQKGVRIPIAYEGFGETVVRVQTPENTDEVRNRRADSIIADEAPPMTGVGLKPSWKKVWLLRCTCVCGSAECLDSQLCGQQVDRASSSDILRHDGAAQERRQEWLRARQRGSGATSREAG